MVCLLSEITSASLKLDFTISEKLHTGRCIFNPLCEDSKSMFCRWFQSSPLNFVGEDLSINSTGLYYRIFQRLERCCDFFQNSENVARLFESILFPPCVNIDDGSKMDRKFQVFPPCRSLCLELNRACNPDWFDCKFFPRPRDTNFNCVPPTEFGISFDHSYNRKRIFYN